MKISERYSNNGPTSWARKDTKCYRLSFFRLVFRKLEVVFLTSLKCAYETLSCVLIGSAKDIVLIIFATKIIEDVFGIDLDLSKLRRLNHRV